MAIELIDGLDIRKNVHIDKRIVQPSSTERDLININYRYEGLTVYCVNTKKEWRLEGGLTNAHWVEKLSGGGTSVTGGNNITVTGTGTVGDPYVVNGDSNSIIEKTHAELLVLMSTSGLVIGQHYLLTEYTSSYILPNSITSILTSGEAYEGNAESFIMTAATVNTFFTEVKSVQHPYDIITYDITDITSIDGTPRRGWITFRKNIQYNVSAPFDFREARVRRYASTVAHPFSTSGGGIFTYWMPLLTFTYDTIDYIADETNYDDLFVFTVLETDSSTFYLARPGYEQFSFRNTHIVKGIYQAGITDIPNINIRTGSSGSGIDNCIFIWSASSYGNDFTFKARQGFSNCIVNVYRSVINLISSSDNPVLTLRYVGMDYVIFSNSTLKHIQSTDIKNQSFERCNINEISLSTFNNASLNTWENCSMQLLEYTIIEQASLVNVNIVSSKNSSIQCDMLDVNIVQLENSNFFNTAAIERFTAEWFYECDIHGNIKNVKLSRAIRINLDVASILASVTFNIAEDLTFVSGRIDNSVIGLASNLTFTNSGFNIVSSASCSNITMMDCGTWENINISGIHSCNLTYTKLRNITGAHVNELDIINVVLKTIENVDFGPYFSGTLIVGLDIATILYTIYGKVIKLDQDQVYKIGYLTTAGIMTYVAITT